MGGFMLTQVIFNERIQKDVIATKLFPEGTEVLILPTYTAFPSEFSGKKFIVTHEGAVPYGVLVGLKTKCLDPFLAHVAHELNDFAEDTIIFQYTLYQNGEIHRQKLYFEFYSNITLGFVYDDIETCAYLLYLQEDDMGWAKRIFAEHLEKEKAKTLQKYDELRKQIANLRTNGGVGDVL